ncbi:DUF4129 domain-containing protein [Actinokineospora sp. NBRC 105648]|uniref:DUF4129 domain-containing protein n=1 Tax=Actinokineospora sp. NBRC 105648 TaxID=3032206 RepID=UPI0025538847|nr:DUF4129 domain-containing protein [Actinokineospora sp. NBRC 105648]
MRSRLPSLLVVAAFLVLAVVAARGESAIPAGPGLAARPDPPPPPPPRATEATEGNPLLDLINGISTGVLLVLIAAMLLIGLAGLLATLAGVRRRRVRLARPEFERADTPEATTGAVAHALATAAQAARLELSRRDGTDADAIITAWLTLERAAATLGTPRAAHQTPTEFTEAVLSAHTPDATALKILRTCYHRARFADTVTEADTAAATDALTRIENSLTTGTPR